MEDWLKLSLLLCTFGIIREFRPSEPYVTKYLNNPPMNFTLTEITQDIYPWATYSNMVLLIFIFLCTDWLRYKAIIILNGLTGIVCYIMLITCRSLLEIQIVEVLYGLFMACDVAYCTYIYSKVESQYYQQVTSFTHGAYLAGRAISGAVSQLLVSTGYFSYYDLNFFTLGAMILATMWSCFLPSVTKSVYFNRSLTDTEAFDDREVPSEEESLSLRKKVKQGCSLLVKDFLAAFSSSYVVKWIFWWALATCGYYQILTYIQLLWEVIDVEVSKQSNWNGLVEALYTILSVISTLACGLSKIDWNRHAQLILAICSSTIGLILLVASQTTFIYVAYAADILVKIIYHGMITIANSEVAKNINPESFALIFGITNFIALCLQSLLTLVVNTILSLPSRTQFVVYSIYFFALGSFFVVTMIFDYIRSKFS